MWDSRVPHPNNGEGWGTMRSRASRLTTDVWKLASGGTVLPLVLPGVIESGPAFGSSIPAFGSSIRNRRGHTAGAGQARPETGDLRSGRIPGDRARHAGAAWA